MTTNFNWRGAFSLTRFDASPAQQREVIRALANWNSDWNWDTQEGYLVRVEDENGDGIWDIDYDDCHDVDQFFGSDFLQWMDTRFLSKKRSKKPVVIGKSTKLPIPGARP